MKASKLSKFTFYLSVSSFLMVVGLAFWMVVQAVALHNLPEPLKVLAVDFEQVYYDTKDPESAADGQKWVINKVSELCGKGSNCLIIKGDVLLGGKVYDINAMYREAHGITTIGEKPKGLETKEIMDFLTSMESAGAK